MNVAVVCMLAALAGCCGAGYTFVQTYHSYVNPQHNRGDTGQCCDSQTRPPCPEGSLCDNIFTICAQDTSQMQPERGNIREQDCPLGYFVSNTFINSDNITFTTSSSLTFTGDIWPGSFRLVIQVYDVDINNPDDFVDILVMELSLSPSAFSTPTPPTAYTSMAGIFTIFISLRVECSENHYGERCDVFCDARNDSNRGYYDCDSDGGKVCLPGYQNPETNCTEAAVGRSTCQECNSLVYTNCTRNCTDGSRDSVAGIIVGVVASVLVIVTVVAIVIFIVILLKKTDIILWRSVAKVQMPGDNPIYLSSTDMNAVSSSSLHSPTHSSASPPSRATDTTPIDDLVPEDQEVGESTEVAFDDGLYTTSTKPYHPPSTPRKLNPYGNYSDSTITRVAGEQLFDDSKYAEWSPPSQADSDDVNSDCISEYL